MRSIIYSYAFFESKVKIEISNLKNREIDFDIRFHQFLSNQILHF